LGGRIKGVCHYFSGLGRTTGFVRREPLPHKCGVPIRLVSERRVYAAGKNLTLRPSTPFLTVWQLLFQTTADTRRRKPLGKNVLGTI